MRRRPAIMWFFVALTVGLTICRASAAEDERAAACVLYNNHLVGLAEDGRIHAWHREDGRYDEAASSQLARKSVTHLASDGGTLWAVDKSTLYAWSPEEHSWKKLAEFKTDGETPVALVGGAGAPLLIFPTTVIDLFGARTHNVPTLKAEVPRKSLRVLAVYATASVLWIGTGNGEWGGHLVGLNIRTGEWTQYHDPFHYVTGITQAAVGELIVSWSMSHFGAETLIRVHKADGTPKSEYPVLNGMYYQSVAYNSFDKSLYGVEDAEIVSIKQGEPTKIADLNEDVLEREPNAIGAAPGIAALLPIAPKTLIVVPNHGFPWQLVDGKLKRLRVP